MTYIPEISSGITEVKINTTLMITENSQMINYGGLTISGIIIINGALILI